MYMIQEIQTTVHPSCKSFPCLFSFRMNGSSVDESGLRRTSVKEVILYFSFL